MPNRHSFIDTPFQYRYVCWFCGEPASSEFSFPQRGHVVLSLKHPSIIVPCCKECRVFAEAAKVATIWQVQQLVKQGLIKKYKKHLAIGVNWTQEELANSQFESGNFAEFQRSAWMMFEIARDRVNFPSWPLEVNGEDIEQYRDSEPETFHFDGTDYPTIDAAAEHFAQVLSIPLDYFNRVLAIVGISHFAKAVRFCRLLVGASPHERQQALRELKQEWRELHHI